METPQQWGGTSRVFAVIGGVIAIFGGFELIGLKAAGENSLIEALAHGIGFYCLGKGVYMIAIAQNARAAVERLMPRGDAQ